MNVIRWRFTDLVTNEVVTLPLNPREMTSPNMPRNMTWAWGSKIGVERIRGVDSATDSATTWSFTGVLFTQEHYELLLEWAGRRTLLRVDDHIGRAWKVVIQRYDPVERLPTAIKPWRAVYTMTCLVLGEIDA